MFNLNFISLDKGEINHVNMEFCFLILGLNVENSELFFALS